MKKQQKQAVVALALVILAISLSLFLGFDSITGFITGDAPLDSVDEQGMPEEQLQLPADNELPSDKSTEAQDSEEEIPDDEEQPEIKPRIIEVGSGGSSYSPVSQPVAELEGSGRISASLQGRIAESDADEMIDIVMKSSDIESVSSKISSLGGNVNSGYASLGMVSASLPAGRVAELAGDTSFDTAWADERVVATGIEGAEQIAAGYLWELGFSGAGVRIAILDSGFDSELSESFVVGENANDENGHGSSIASAVADIAPNAQLLNAKVLDKNAKGTVSAVLAGMEWALENSAHILLTSFTTDDTTQDNPLNEAVKKAFFRGVLVVAPAGNCGPCGPCHFSGVGSPGNSPYALTAGAVDNSNRWLCFSGGISENGFVKPDIAAPSESGDLRGTSVSAAHTAGAAALLLEMKPGLNPQEAKMLIESATLDMGVPGKDERYGAGVIDLKRILAPALIRRISVDPGGYPSITIKIEVDADADSVAFSVIKPDGSVYETGVQKEEFWEYEFSDTQQEGTYAVKVEAVKDGEREIAHSAFIIKNPSVSLFNPDNTVGFEDITGAGIFDLFLGEPVVSEPTLIRSDKSDPAAMTVGDLWHLWASTTRQTPKCSCWDWDGDGLINHCYGQGRVFVFVGDSWAKACYDAFSSHDSNSGWNDAIPWDNVNTMDTSTAITNGRVNALVFLSNIFQDSWLEDSITYTIINPPQICTPLHNTFACSDGDVYYYNACNVRTNDKKQECGPDYCDAPSGFRYCSSNNVYQSQTCYTTGCASASCFKAPYSRQTLVETCTSGCQNGQCIVCTSQSYSACFGDDLYWYDSCNRRQGIRQDCGDTTYGAWSASYCSGNSVVRSRDVNARGCSSASCTANTYTEVQTLEVCQFSCSGSSCLKPDFVVRESEITIR
ncbi:MAG: S8 family serine peptidase [Candidatus Aenigmarchaeota archaeon]|nr:S8 family serine peptidase [Candidatus Aenigmarchaeota archaeon]